MNKHEKELKNYMSSTIHFLSLALLRNLIIAIREADGTQRLRTFN